MRLEHLWADYKDYTDKLSSQARVLAFGAVSICWFFRGEQATLTAPVVCSLVLAVAFFASDLLQYYLAAVMLRSWTRSEEKRKWVTEGTIEGEYEKPA